VAAVEVFANDPQGIVTTGGTTAPASGTVENWTVDIQVAFPHAVPGTSKFHVADPAAGYQTEKILVTSGAGSVGTQNWTVTRGDEGTTPLAHLGGFVIRDVVTAGWYSSVTSSGGLTQLPWNLLGGFVGSNGDPGMAWSGVTGTAFALSSFIYAMAVTVDTVTPFSKVAMLGNGAQVGSGSFVVVTDSAGNWVAHATNVDAAFTGISGLQYVDLTLNTTVTPSAVQEVFYVMVLCPLAVTTPPTLWALPNATNWMLSQSEVPFPSSASSFSGSFSSIPNPQPLSGLTENLNLPFWCGFKP